MNVSYRNLMSSQKLTNNSTHFSFLVLLCINKNSLKDFSVLKLLILIYILNLKHQCFCCSNATEIAFLEMNVLACMPRNMLHSWWYVTCVKTSLPRGCGFLPVYFAVNGCCHWMMPGCQPIRWTHLICEQIKSFELCLLIF